MMNLVARGVGSFLAMADSSGLFPAATTKV